jgi:hypothetical protein
MTELHEEAFTAFEAANENPALAAAAAKLAGETSEQPAPTLADPSDGPVTLPGGFRRVKVDASGASKFEEVRNAWVRELNGLDEEKISKARLSGNPDDFIRAVLEAGVERLGDERPGKDDFNSLLLGDRDFLLVQISAATYGDKIEYKEIECPHCREPFDVTISATEDIPCPRLESVDDQNFEVKLRKDRVAKVSLPTFAVSAALMDTETAAEANTLLISNYVTEIVGDKGTLDIKGDPDAARKLGILDRQALIDEMYKRMPGPQYNGVRFDHEPGCGKEVRLEVSMADLFRGL